MTSVSLLGVYLSFRGMGLSLPLNLKDPHQIRHRTQAPLKVMPYTRYHAILAAKFLLAPVLESLLPPFLSQEAAETDDFEQGIEADAIEAAVEELLHIPRSISNCLQQPVFRSTAPWRLKLANFGRAAHPQILSLFDALVERLHVDGEIERARGAEVRHSVRELFLSVACGERQSQGVQCMPARVDDGAPQDQPPSQPPSHPPSEPPSEPLSQPLSEPLSQPPSQPPSQSSSQSLSQSMSQSSPQSQPPLQLEADPKIQSLATKYSKFGVVLDGSVVKCLPCNQRGFDGQSLLDHLTSDAHEHAVHSSDWKYRVHLAGGFPRRQQVRVQRQDNRRQALENRKKSATEQKKRTNEDIQAEYREERKKRRAEIATPSIPPLPPPSADSVPQVQSSLLDSKVHGPARRRESVCGGLLQCVYAAGIPLYCVRKMLPWLKRELTDGGFLPNDEKSLQEYDGPRVVLEQSTNIRERIFKEREHGITLIVDETSDTVDDTEPVNVVIITAKAAYFVDTIFVKQEREDTDKYGDCFGQTVVEWWDAFFAPHDSPDTPPLRKDVVAIVTDNVNYNIGAFKRHLKPRFPTAQHVRCVAHVLNLVGQVFRDHKYLMVLREFMSKTRSLLKGKKNIRRRQRLRAFLRSNSDVGDPAVNTPPDWADTRWSGWYDCAAWHVKHFSLLQQWVAKEANNPDAPATVTDLHMWLQVNTPMVRLQLIFVVEHAVDVFDLMQHVQVSVAATFCQSAEKRKAKPTMHRVYNQMHDLHQKLKAMEQKLQPLTEKRLTMKSPNGGNQHNAVQMRSQFLEVVRSACDKLWKYVGKHMEFSKEARVLDPTQMARFSKNIADFSLVFPPAVHDQLVQSGEWALYRASVTPSTPQFDILNWWDSMADRLPVMYRYARRVLSIPHTSCDVERSFSAWKRVRSEKQQSMKEKTHKAYVSFCFNGVVPPP